MYSKRYCFADMYIYIPLFAKASRLLFRTKKKRGGGRLPIPPHCKNRVFLYIPHTYLHTLLLSETSPVSFYPHNHPTPTLSLYTHRLNLIYNLPFHQQTRPTHLLRFRKSHDLQQRRRHVPEHAVLLLETPPLGRIGHDEGDFVRRMRGLGFTLLVEHLFRVTTRMYAPGSVN